MVVPRGAKRSVPWWNRDVPLGKPQLFMYDAPGTGHTTRGHVPTAPAHDPDPPGMRSTSPGMISDVIVSPLRASRSSSATPWSRAMWIGTSPGSTTWVPPPPDDPDDPAAPG